LGHVDGLQNRTQKATKRLKIGGREADSDGNEITMGKKIKIGPVFQEAQGMKERIRGGL